MADHIRPLLIGYFREMFFATASEKAAIMRRLTEFAAREGYTLDSILCQDFDQTWSEFDRLLERISFRGISTVVISAPADLNQDQRLRLQHKAVHVLTAPPP